jgi:NDP-sugar pyrophosphorylase family protein
VDAVVIAAGEGRRLRPLTERWAKAVLPIDGRPVLATLLRELAAGELRRVWLVTGYLGEQVRALAGSGEGFGLDVQDVRQPSVQGSADAVARAVEAGAETPLVVSAADTVFRHGDVAAFARNFVGLGAAGAIAVRREPPPGEGRPAMLIRDGWIERIEDRNAAGGLSGAPLWALDGPVVERLRCDREPYELENSFQAAIDAGERIAAIEIGKTRDLTHPLDLVEENFPYLGVWA